jgi:UDP-N-acetylglucosamine 2-epimerase (non-hydrolysing)
MKTIVSVCSARPNFVKVAAVHHALAAYPEQFRHIIVHTGQHYDPLFSDIFFEQLTIPLPGHNLGIHGGTREELLAATQTACESVFSAIQPDLVLVYGDVNGALAGARAAKECGLQLGHVEAGLRSYDSSMPEELNRIAIDALADLLFCSEGAGVEHLNEEGVSGKIFLVGNTMIDTLVRMMPLIDAAELPLSINGPFAVATLHRPSNVDDPEKLREVLSFFSEVSRHIPLVLPAHHRLTAAITEFGLSDMVDRRIALIPPLGYVPFLRMVKESSFILTDSGGIQEEATFLKKRCFTLRRNTERPITISSGSNVLVDTAVHADRGIMLGFAEHPLEFSVTVPALWDGKAGERIIAILKN